MKVLWYLLVLLICELIVEAEKIKKSPLDNANYDRKDDNDYNIDSPKMSSNHRANADGDVYSAAYNNADGLSDNDLYESSGDLPVEDAVERLKEHDQPDIDISGDSEKDSDKSGHKYTTVSSENTENLPTNDPNDDSNQNNGIHTMRISDRSLIGNPTLLAAIIGGTMAGLVCALVLTVLIVYKMKKKDEGSYPLEEPTKFDQHGDFYIESRKEFYA